jgi:GNAT superfamily N-acetyltransferase
MVIDLIQQPQIAQANPADIAEILELQRLAYQSEAHLYHNFAIQPLTQTLTQAIGEFHRSFVLKAVYQGRIIGSVRATEEPATVWINKLIVHPDYQDQGLGKYLMQFIESFFFFNKCSLFTGAKSWKNIALYTKLGYVIYQEKADPTGFAFAYLAKTAAITATVVPRGRAEQPTKGAVLSATTLPESPEERYKRLLREKGGLPRAMQPQPG